jgi:hypothetical protein
MSCSLLLLTFKESKFGVPTFFKNFIILVYFDKAIHSCARKYTVFSATVIALSSLLQTLLTEVERLDLSFGANMAFWWSALAACL